MSDDPLKTALEAKAPEIKEPAADDSALRTGLKLGGLTILDLRNLVLSIGVLVLALAALEWTWRDYRTAFGAAVILTALCLANILWNTITLIRHRRREVVLHEWAVQPLPSFEADYFRVGPYTGSAADCKRYRRPDALLLSPLDALPAMQSWVPKDQPKDLRNQQSRVSLTTSRLSQGPLW